MGWPIQGHIGCVQTLLGFKRGLGLCVHWMLGMPLACCGLGVHLACWTLTCAGWPTACMQGMNWALSLLSITHVVCICCTLIRVAWGCILACARAGRVGLSEHLACCVTWVVRLHVLASLSTRGLPCTRAEGKSCVMYVMSTSCLGQNMSFGFFLELYW